jgi:ERO1-like protein alpha
MKRNYYKKFIIYLIIFYFFIKINDNKEINEKEIIDDCCCNVETVIKSNNYGINPLINKIISKKFFKYFKTDLYTECPLWVSDSTCGLNSCSICESNEDDVPKFWNKKKTDLVEIKMPPNFLKWKDKSEYMWIIQCPEEEMSYINLEMYPESNTGYGQGKDSGIWQIIYKENCFKGPLDSLCLEERILFRLISGLHTSINTHVSTNYEFDNLTNEWKSNKILFNKLVRNFPDRIKNLYFSYLFILRALNKAKPFLEQYHYDTGNPEEDQEVQKLIKELLSIDILCQPNFDETTLFNEPKKEIIKQQFKNHFRNISLIMNCVSCEKCKIWAKLQILGIGSALKILFDHECDLIMERNEIIALFNTLRQFSDSILFIKKFQNESFS